MLSPQIYSHKFNKLLCFNVLYYPFHRMSSRFTAEGENTRRKNGRIKDKSVKNVPGPSWRNVPGLSKRSDLRRIGQNQDTIRRRYFADTWCPNGLCCQHQPHGNSHPLLWSNRRKRGLKTARSPLCIIQFFFIGFVSFAAFPPFPIFLFRLFLFLAFPSRISLPSFIGPGTFLQLGRRYRNVFSGEKLPKGIFCPKTAGLNVEGIVPPSYLLKGTWQVKRGLWWIFIE